MKKYGLLCLLLLAISYLQAQGNRILVDKVVAKVGDNIILYSDVEEQYRALDYKPANAKCLIMDQLMANALLLVQAEIDSIVVLDEEVQVQLDARIDRILRLMGYDIEQFKAYYGKTPEEVKEEFRPDLRNQLIAQRMQGNLTQELSVTPSEVKAFFENIPADSLPYFNSEVEIGEIVIKPDPNEDELKKARDQLADIRKRIVENGEDFAKLALANSDDKGSGSKGGDLQWAKRGQFVPEFEAAAYKLKKDEISPVIRTEFGYHIIQMLERRGNLVHLRHILIKPKITEQDLEKSRVFLDSIAWLVRVDSIPFTRAVALYSSEKAQSKTNGGRLMNPKTGNSIFEVGDLDPEVYFTIDTMKTGDVSKPFKYLDRQTGEEMFRVIVLQSRTEPHQANLKDDYAKIQTAAVEQKRARFLSDWVSKKVKDTYVKVDNGFMGCSILQKWVNDAKTTDNKIKSKP